MVLVWFDHILPVTDNMVKVKMLKRDPADHLRETKQDIHKLSRNYDPELHPFDVNREYVRAANAVKLERVFAKPFLGGVWIFFEVDKYIYIQFQLKIYFILYERILF